MRRLGLTLCVLLLLGWPALAYAAGGQHMDRILGAGLLGLALVISWLGQRWLRRRKAESQLRAHQAVLEVALKRESVLSEVASILNASDDFERSLDAVLKTLGARLPVARVAVYSYYREGAAKIPSRVAVSGEVRALDELSVHASVEQSPGLLTPIVSSDLGELCAPERSFFHSRGVAAVVLVPMQVAGRVKGALSFAQVLPYSWAPDEVSLFETLGALLAASWERYEQMVSRLQAESKQAETIEALEKQMRISAVGVMAAGLSHELNQPLNAIRIAVDSALRRGVPQNTERWVNVTTRKLTNIREATTRIDQIIRHMREYWGDRDRRDFEWVDLRESVERSIELLSRRARRQGIKLSVEQPEVPVLVRASVIQLEQVVTNLLMNAVQALERAPGERKRVRVRVWTEAHSAWLSVCDSGPGVPEADVDKLFDPEFSTKEPGYGTGLGLAIVKRIVDAFEGRIQYAPAELGGASFTLQLSLQSGEKVLI